MNEMHCTRDGDVIIFCDEGIVIHYTWDGKNIRRYYPYGSIQSIKVDNLLLGSVFAITAKNLASNGKNYMNGFSFYKSDRTELEKSVAFAKSKMETAPNDEMVQTDSNNIPKSEEEFISKAAIQCGKRREHNRLKFRNIGLSILLISIFVILYACFGPSGAGMGVLAILAIFVGFVGFFMFGSHLKPPAQIFIPKAKSGTKEIIKGAIIGGIVAGDVGAVVGATIAKNKLDNKN